MTGRTIRLMGLALAVMLALTFTAIQMERGNDSYAALAVYAHYAPGNTVPAYLTCRWLTEFSPAYSQMCALSDTPYCQQGYVSRKKGLSPTCGWHNAIFLPPI